MITKGKIKILQSVALLLLLSSCFVGKITRNGSQLNNSEIEVAIDHFTRTPLFKSDSVFSVSSHISGSLDRRIVGIIPWSRAKILVTKDVYVGSKNHAPSRFVVINKKLFYWWDPTIALTQEALDVLRRFQLLQDDRNGTVVIPDAGVDDRAKVAYYHFCLDTNSRKFKHIVSRRPPDNITAPKLRCK